MARNCQIGFPGTAWRPRRSAAPRPSSGTSRTRGKRRSSPAAGWGPGREPATGLAHAVEGSRSWLIRSALVKPEHEPSHPAATRSGSARGSARGPFQPTILDCISCSGQPEAGASTARSKVKKVRRHGLDAPLKESSHACSGLADGESTFGDVIDGVAVQEGEQAALLIPVPIRVIWPPYLNACLPVKEHLHRIV